eukprot:2921339-Pleurochrysis_carterae.AAC.2
MALVATRERGAAARTSRLDALPAQRSNRPDAEAEAAEAGDAPPFVRSDGPEADCGGAGSAGGAGCDVLVAVGCFVAGAGAGVVAGAGVAGAGVAGAGVAEAGVAGVGVVAGAAGDALAAAQTAVDDAMAAAAAAAVRKQACLIPHANPSLVHALRASSCCCARSSVSPSLVHAKSTQTVWCRLRRHSSVAVTAAAAEEAAVLGVLAVHTGAGHTNSASGWNGCCQQVAARWPVHLPKWSADLPKRVAGLPRQIADWLNNLADSLKHLAGSPKEQTQSRSHSRT